MDVRRERVSRSRSGSRGKSRLSILRKMDFTLLFAGFGLSAFGIFAMYIVDTDTGYDYASNQFLGFLAGSAIALMLVIYDYRSLKLYTGWMYAAGIASLVLVLLFGAVGGGAQSWIDIGPAQIQPSEFVKLIMVIVLATYVSRNAAGNARVFAGSLGLVALPTFLISAQPDLGTALVLGAVFVMIMFVGGAKLWQLILLGAASVAAAVGAVRFGILQDYQLVRLTSFLDPASSADGVGYQVLQSQNAIGSGGILGKGLDAATLANLGFLPEEQTDFIFSNIAERLGFTGGIILLALFFVLIWRILRVAGKARDRFGVLLAVGIGTIFLFHVVVNVGMTMGIMPVTGIPLPFVSYGRSSLVVSLISLGILQSIAARSETSEVGELRNSKGSKDSRSSK